MVTQQTKYKRGIELSANGIPVWVELDQNGDCVFVCYQKTRDVTKGDEFVWIEREALKVANKGRSTISSKPKVLTDTEKTDKQKLDEFYSRIALRMPYNCENCLKPLYAFNKTAKRSVTCHLLPKSIFESIATDPQNIVFMGADYIGCPCNCHDRYDSNVDTRIKMPIYKVALERFETDLKFKLTPRELKQAFTYLNIEWK